MLSYNLQFKCKDGGDTIYTKVLNGTGLYTYLFTDLLSPNKNMIYKNCQSARVDDDLLNSQKEKKGKL